MLPRDKQLRAAMRRRGWHTESGTCWKQVWVYNEDTTIEINPIIIPDRISIRTERSDVKCVYLTIDEMKKIVELAELNNKVVKDFRRNERKKKKK